MPEDIADSTEKTGIQVSGGGMYGNDLTNPLKASYRTYRTIRKHPTVAIARALGIAPIVAGAWAVKTRDGVTEEESVEQRAVIKDVFFPQREHIMEHALYGGTDFGWGPFETVWERRGKWNVIDKFKPLLHDITEILIDPATGAFAGYEQRPMGGKPVTLDPLYTLHVAFRIEGTQWHGQSLMENIRATYNQWQEANAGARRYDNKVAGSHIVIYYPPGSTKFGSDQTETANSTIATSILKALESSGSVTIPDRGLPAGVGDVLEQAGWRVEMLEDKGGRQPTFVDRLKYVDALLVRGLLMPERVILEGQFGTKAESGEQKDVALTNMELLDRKITRFVNKYAVDRVLRQNWGEDWVGQVFLEAAPLTDEAIGFQREVYKAFLTNPTTILDEREAVDMSAMRQRVMVPELPEEERVLLSENPVEAGDRLRQIAARIMQGDRRVPEAAG